MALVRKGAKPAEQVQIDVAVTYLGDKNVKKGSIELDCVFKKLRRTAWENLVDGKEQVDVVRELTVSAQSDAFIDDVTNARYPFGDDLMDLLMDDTEIVRAMFTGCAAVQNGLNAAKVFKEQAAKN
jgi:hypothetical protein